MRRIIRLGFALALASGGALAEEAATEPAVAEPPPVFAPELPKPPAKPVEAYIPFANMHGAIQSWELNGDTGIWIRSGTRKWYYATFFIPCQGLQFELSLGFMPDSSGRLDRFASIYTPGSGRCRFSSLVESAPPPPRLAKRQQPAPEKQPKPRQ